MSRTWRHTASIALTVITLLAILAQGLMPAGFMPGQRDGETSIVICTGTGPATITLGPEFNPLAGKNDHKASDVPSCPFAPVLAQDSTIPAPSFGPAFNTIRLVLTFPPVDMGGAAPAHTYLAQGPPASLA